MFPRMQINLYYNDLNKHLLHKEVEQMISEYCMEQQQNQVLSSWDTSKKVENRIKTHD